ncbi:hypothetical protein Cgig2_023978 [Carnegiea gigantea]|uniref:LOB domain-containing protein n=1 Tax=Carnegiea gigantea TaxID=171969 RepID=A0A9Q1KBB4_9CARY|nr:hypothetical protein Cgig2_023978 [Carnegiea gigantea]
MGGSSPCASCKLLRRRCAKNCIFAPYFPSDDPQRFAIVHKVFGASNVSKMLQEIPVHQRADAVSSLVYEANARIRDPVYGCVGAISYLQSQVSQLQMQLAMAQAEILSIKQQQQVTELVQNQEMILQQVDAVVDHEDDEKEKSSFVNFPNYNLSYLQQYFNFAASDATANVIQDPPIPKREFLWA